ncbi:MAG: XdhC family protein, partial [Bacteroidota bacterium]
MIHELKQIVEYGYIAGLEGKRCVLATVVALDASSYRKPGVRMLIREDGDMVGAVSGGCVEKDVVQNARQVFSTGESLVMTYDGRYRLGCEGTLFILLEPFSVDADTFATFSNYLKTRRPISLTSYFRKVDRATGAFGTWLEFNETQIAFHDLPLPVESL